MSRDSRSGETPRTHPNRPIAKLRGGTAAVRASAGDACDPRFGGRGSRRSYRGAAHRQRPRNRQGRSGASRDADHAAAARSAHANRARPHEVDDRSPHLARTVPQARSFIANHAGPLNRPIGVLGRSPRLTAPATRGRRRHPSFRSGLMAIPLRRLRAVAQCVCVLAGLALATTNVASAQTKTPPAGKTAGDFRIGVEPRIVSSSRESSVATFVVLDSIDRFEKAAALTVSNLPAGVSAKFAPAALAATANGSSRSKLTLNVAADAAAGTYPITVIGRSGDLVRSTTVDLVVTADAGYKLVLSGTQHVTPIGGSSQLPVTVVGTAFNAPVTLGVSGLPAGVRAAFGLNPVYPGAKAAVNSTLTLQASAQAVQGVYPLTITGTSGGTVRSARIDLYVNPAPDFTLWTVGRSRALVAVTQQAGISGWLEINARPLHAWNQPIAFSMEGLPAGVNARFSPTVVDPYGPTSIAFTASADAAPGIYQANVVATAASATHRLPVQVTVLPYIDPNRLPNELTRVGMSLRAGESLLFNIMKPEGYAPGFYLNTQVGFGTGRGTLYVREGAPPTDSEFHCRTSGLWSTFCRVERNPQAEFPLTYFLRLKADTDIEGASVMAAYGADYDARPRALFANPTDYLINDNTVIESPLTVGGANGNGGIARVSYRVSHPHRSDLKIELIAPDGRAYLLRDHHNGPINPSPELRLDLTDQVANGVWKLRVTDDVLGGSGTLLHWTLDFFRTP
ncbi:proprotein convertase P-domain-containing protein [Lysobacter antibioticus]|uniref:proprotein convertase P-domain-containing protein n=1 Tax=Lysobacter antibioticus TaxID=84531 RepID=UPI00164803A1|nr:proprotein convertase P-domain-containing protein [Lysobacter antibioticus]